MSPHSANLRQARLMAEHYRKTANHLCLWAGVAAAAALGAVAVKLADFIPSDYWNVFASTAWVPIYAAGWFVNKTLQDRSEAHLRALLEQQEQESHQAPRATF